MSAAQDLEIAILKLKAEKAGLLNACKLMVDYTNANTTDDDILDLMYANAIAGIKAAIKGATA